MKSSSVHIRAEITETLGITLGAARTVSMVSIAGTLGTAPGAAQIVRTANIRWIQRAASVVREAAEDTIRESQIEGAARITETLRAAERDRVIEEAA